MAASGQQAATTWENEGDLVQVDTPMEVDGKQDPKEKSPTNETSRGLTSCSTQVLIQTDEQITDEMLENAIKRHRSQAPGRPQAQEAEVSTWRQVESEPTQIVLNKHIGQSVLLLFVDEQFDASPQNTATQASGEERQAIAHPDAIGATRGLARTAAASTSARSFALWSARMSSRLRIEDVRGGASTGTHSSSGHPDQVIHRDVEETGEETYAQDPPEGHRCLRDGQRLILRAKINIAQPRPPLGPPPKRLATAAMTRRRKNGDHPLY